MKSRDKERLATIRLMQSEFKRVEVDERIELSEDRVLAILDKMVKQRRDSQKQYEDAGRENWRHRKPPRSLRSRSSSRPSSTTQNSIP
jgi:uncharacterized protein YqeY